MFENIIKNKSDHFFRKFGDSNQIIARSTGEVKEYPKWFKMHNLKIKITRQLATVEGSVHKYYNISIKNQDQNYDDFTYSQFMWTFNSLLKHLDNFSTGRLTTLEFGFNIEPRLNVKEIIEHRLHRFNDCSNTEESLTFSKVYKEFRFTNFDFKIYDKGRRHREFFPSMPNILRTELRLRGKELGMIDIYHSSDLLLKKNLRKLFKLFLRRFDDVVIIDSIPLDLPETEKNLIFDYRHQEFWSRHLSSEYHPQSKKRLKEKIENLIETFGLNTTKMEIRNLLLEKYLYLINN